MTDENTNKPPQTPETITVNKDALDKLIAKVDLQAEEIKKLNAISDKGRLAHWEQQHKGSIPKLYYLNVLDGKVILSWEMIKNRVWKEGGENGRWREDQIIKVNLEDETSVEIPYVEFTANLQKIQASLVDSRQIGDKVYLKVRTEKGKEIKIDSLFIN